MRFYLVNDEDEVVVDCTKTIIHSSELVEFIFSTLKDNKICLTQKIWVRSSGGSLFVSSDGTSWEKVAKQNLPNQIVNVDKIYNVYRGFKPSGFFSRDEGELLTKMSGKVVSVQVKEGQQVSKGQVLAIFSSMKMENEIKSPKDGILRAVHVKAGDVLDENILMMEIEDQ